VNINNSITAQIIIPFVLVVSMFLAGFGGLNYSQTKVQLEQQLEEQVKNSLHRMALSLPELIWNYELELLEKSAQSEMNSRFLAGIVVKSNESEILVSKVKDMEGNISDKEVDPKGYSNVRTKALIYSDESENSVGSVTVYVDNSVIKEPLNSFLQKSVMGIVVLDLAIIALLYFILSRKVLSPLRSINRAVHDIAEGDGDLTQRLDIKKQDEIGQLALSVNKFIAKLQGIIQQVSSTSEQLVDSANTTQSTTDKTQSDLYSQRDHVLHFASATTQVNVTNDEVIRNIKTASNSANDAMLLAKDGSQVIVDTVSAIENLANKVETITHVIQRLETEGAQISSMTEEITSITEQINLLALNAAIEAARAGEHGRGFAVVADEVRNLALRTKGSTVQINQVVERLQSSTGEAVKVMQQAQSQAQLGVVQAKKADASIIDISQSISAFSEMSDQVASAADEQTNAVKDISLNISDTLKVVEGTVYHADKTVQSSALSAQLASDLRQLVALFKI